jgi:hypothetical protein
MTTRSSLKTELSIDPLDHVRQHGAALPPEAVVVDAVDPLLLILPPLRLRLDRLHGDPRADENAGLDRLDDVVGVPKAVKVELPESQGPATTMSIAGERATKLDLTTRSSGRGPSE